MRTIIPSSTNGRTRKSGISNGASLVPTAWNAEPVELAIELLTNSKNCRCVENLQRQFD